MVIDKHYGHIDLKSEVDKGTVFTITLPNQHKDIGDKSEAVTTTSSIETKPEEPKLEEPQSKEPKPEEVKKIEDKTEKNIKEEFPATGLIAQSIKNNT